MEKNWNPLRQSTLMLWKLLLSNEEEEEENQEFSIYETKQDFTKK